MRSRAVRRIAPLAFGAAIALLMVAPAPVAAQNDQQPSGERGTELGGLIGVGTNETHTGLTLAGIAGWQVSGWAIVEARGAWLERGDGANGFEADVGALVKVVRKVTVAPYVGAGFGLYQAKFDGPDATMSDFYRQRIEEGAVTSGTQTFVDPALRLSAGADFRVSRRVSLRPEASAIIVRRDGRGETIGWFGLRFSFRFEDHPVTPQRVTP